MMMMILEFVVLRRKAARGITVCVVYHNWCAPFAYNKNSIIKVWMVEILWVAV